MSARNHNYEAALDAEIAAEFKARIASSAPHFPTCTGSGAMPGYDAHAVEVIPPAAPSPVSADRSSPEAAHFDGSRPLPLGVTVGLWALGAWVVFAVVVTVWGCA